MLIFEHSATGRKGKTNAPNVDTNISDIPSELLRKTSAPLPEVSEMQAVRHYTSLSQKNFSIDTHFYPLGSCTMKYNPKACEAAANLPELTEVHPLWPQLRGGGLLTQGSLAILYNTERLLSEATGLDEFTLQPMAGAHGELTGVMIMAAYHKDRGNSQKDHILIPDSAHGPGHLPPARTGPATDLDRGRRNTSIGRASRDQGWTTGATGRAYFAGRRLPQPRCKPTP